MLKQPPCLFLYLLLVVRVSELQGGLTFSDILPPALEACPQVNKPVTIASHMIPDCVLLLCCCAFKIFCFIELWTEHSTVFAFEAAWVWHCLVASPCPIFETPRYSLEVGWLFVTNLYFLAKVFCLIIFLKVSLSLPQPLVDGWVG